MTFKEGRDTRWAFEMDNNNGMAGPMEAQGELRIKDDDGRPTWTQPPEAPAVSIAP